MTAVGVLILSPDALLVRSIGTDVWTLIFWRALLTGGLTSIALLLIYKRRFLQCFLDTGKTGLLSAMTITIGPILFVHSLKQTSAANTLIILAATPVISSLLSWIFLREAIPRRTWIAIATCFCGILIIFSGSLKQGLLLGDLLALGATTMWGANVVIVRSGKSVNMVPANVLGNICVAFVALVIGAQPLMVTPQDAGLLLLLGGLILPVSFALITLGPRYLQAPEVSLILLAETVLGPFWVWLVVHEAPHQRTLIAGVLILTTLITHTLVSLRKD